jgi:hypothetical protein
MRTSLLVGMLAAAGLLMSAGQGRAQVIYYGTPGYYHSPHNPLVRTWSTPYVYSTYSSPIIVPTRFVVPAWGSVTWGTAGQAQATASATTTKEGAKNGNSEADSNGSTADEKGSGEKVTRAVAVAPPAPAFVQVGHSTYTPAPVAVGSVYYSGDAYIPPSRYYYYPYSTYPTAGFAPYGPTLPPATSYPYSTYAGYTSPYFQISYGQGYGGWGAGRGWGYRW